MIDSATRIEHTMRAHLPPRWTVTLADPSDLAAFEDADALVLGSAVYLGHWLRPPTTALRAIKDSPLLNLWLFSTGPISDDVDENARVIAAADLVEKACAVEHMAFAGRLESSDLAWWERALVRAVGAASGDRRNWAAVDYWVSDIARQLSATTAKSPSEPRA